MEPCISSKMNLRTKMMLFMLNLCVQKISRLMGSTLPNSYHLILIRNIVMDQDIVLSVSEVNFLRSMVLLAETMMWAIARVGPHITLH